MCEFFWFLTNQMYIYLNNKLRKKLQVLLIFGKGNIFTQPIAKKDMSFVNLRWYQRICIRSIAKKKKVFWHFTILLCAPYFKLYNFIKCSYFLYFFHFPSPPLSPNICFAFSPYFDYSFNLFYSKELFAFLLSLTHVMADKVLFLG